MGLHCLRLSRHFAQRERGRKNLDEDDFHLGLLALLHMPVVDGYQLPLSVVVRERTDRGIVEILERRRCNATVHSSVVSNRNAGRPCTLV
jgi:hypothetical protein